MTRQDDLVAVTIRGGGELPHLTWALGKRWLLPRAPLAASGFLQCIGRDGVVTPSAELQPIALAAADAVRRYGCFIRRPPMSARLPFSYRRLPGSLRSAIAGAYGRWQRTRVSSWARFPGWPLDLGADMLADLASPTSARSGRTPVILTHDLDSPEGLTLAVERFLGLEEEVGARSVNFVVPCGWTLDRALLDEIRARGHEIGVHGYDHANRTPHAPADERTRRLDAGLAKLGDLASGGYRAPSLVRTSALLKDLSARYRYDSSIPTSGGLFPAPNNGCASARPFTIEGIAEIPLSLPRDGSLLFLGYDPLDIADLWIRCAEEIADARGVVVLLTHCEERFSGQPAMLEAYRRLLDHLAGSDRFAWSSPAAVLAQAIPTAMATSSVAD